IPLNSSDTIRPSTNRFINGLLRCVPSDSHFVENDPSRRDVGRRRAAAAADERRAGLHQFGNALGKPGGREWIVPAVADAARAGVGPHEDRETRRQTITSYDLKDRIKVHAA